MEQPCSGFAPHAIALREGQKILVKNDSPVTHALQWSGSLQSGNQAMPPGARITVGDLLYHRQALRVTCATAPLGGGVVAQSSTTRITALTDPQGHFEIKNAPGVSTDSWSGTNRRVAGGKRSKRSEGGDLQ